MKIECFPQKVYQESWLSKLDLIGTAQPQLVLLIDPPYICMTILNTNIFIIAYNCIIPHCIMFVLSAQQMGQQNSLKSERVEVMIQEDIFR